MPGGDVYGYALLAAHRLESQAAKSPRIVVGQTLVDVLEHLSNYSNPRVPTPYAQQVAKYAGDCRLLLRKDGDRERQVTVLNPLASWLTVAPDPTTRKVFSDAHTNVKNELKRHREDKNETLISRYETLCTYFDDHAKRWTEGVPPIG